MCFGFKKSWHLNIGAKCANKMLMKLTPCHRLYHGFRNINEKSGKMSLKPLGNLLGKWGVSAQT
jgi:hypothetical protein